MASKWQIRHVEKGILDSGEVEIALESFKTKHIIDIDVSSHVILYGDERKLYVGYQLQSR